MSDAKHGELGDRVDLSAPVYTVEQTGHTPAGTAFLDGYGDCPFCPVRSLHRHFLLDAKMPLKT